jgi:hypothetical protein
MKHKVRRVAVVLVEVVVDTAFFSSGFIDQFDHL